MRAQSRCVQWQETLKIRLWAFAKIPLIGYVRPRVERVDADEVDIVIPLGRRTKNHWGTMYFGALAIGADLAAGMHAMHAVGVAKEQGHRIGFVFKDVEAEFTRRPDGDVHFRSRDGKAVAKAVAKAAKTGERVNIPVPVECTANGHDVARFTLTLSLKRT